MSAVPYVMAAAFAVLFVTISACMVGSLKHSIARREWGAAAVTGGFLAAVVLCGIALALIVVTA